MRQYLEDPTLGLVRSKRAPQLVMYDACVDIFENGGIGLIQAGTGTGKSFAYLAALLQALSSGKIKRAVIATAKKTLQTQLFLKDLPAISALKKATFASLKGKGNYLCQLRYDEFLQQGGAYQHPQFPFEKFDDWIEKHNTGDFALFDQEVPFEYQVRVTECAGHHCPHFVDCGYADNRLKSTTASLLVVNHSLLAMDFMLGRGKVIGPYDALVVDEAHQLASFARKAFSHEFFSQQADYLQNALQADYRIKFPDKLKDDYSKLFEILSRVESGPLDITHPEINRAVKNVGDTLAGLKNQMQNLGIDVSEGIEGAAFVEANDAETARNKSKIDSAGRMIAKLLKGLSIIRANEDDFLSAIERRNPGDIPRMTVTPLEVRPYIGPQLREINRVILTSATLATTDGFGYISRELGIEPKQARVQLRLESPFDFKNRTAMWIPPEAPAFNFAEKAKNYQFYIEECHRLCEASRGGVFILCSSREDMREIAAGLMLKKSPIYNVLTQSDNVDRDILQFSQGYNNVLIGVKSIWEGVDVPGMKLRMVIIPRLPFPNKGDHLHNARKDMEKARLVSQGADPERVGLRLFSEYDVQMVAMDLAQGAGRLVRTESDFGALVLLDSRMHRGAKQYTNGLRALLPHPLYETREKAYSAINIFANLADREQAAKK